MAVLVIFKVAVPVFTYKLYLCEYMQRIGRTVSQQHGSSSSSSMCWQV